MAFLDNTRKPVGFGGKVMVRMMNLLHGTMAHWGMQFLPLAPDARVLDCGCGGGTNIRTLLKKCPQGIVKGVDYSAVSAETARKLNQRANADNRCAIWQGGVERLIFAGAWFDVVTAFETVYFWKDLPRCFAEVNRVLKPGGTFFICNECGSGNPWESRVEGMRVPTDDELRAALTQAGFGNIEMHANKYGWHCVLARKNAAETAEGKQ